jgi:hypothetical protein
MEFNIHDMHITICSMLVWDVNIYVMYYILNYVIICNSNKM